MLDLVPRDISCPYCGEQIDILVDPSITEQSYIEDCQVCCRPMVLETGCNDAGRPRVSVWRDDD